MTPERFRIVKHLTAAVFAVMVSGIFILGVDGLLSAMQKLTRIFAAQAPVAVEAPATEVPATPGVVPAFVVPANPGEGQTSAK